ncbi:MAG: class I adenylate-forming enzyme family protein [Chloroflexota bacterium]
MLQVQAKPQAEADKYIQSGVWNDDTMYSLLQKCVAQHPNKVAILGDGVELTYIQWEAQALRLAGQLQTLGVQRGDVVGVQLPNSPEFFISWLAIAALGAVIQTIHMPYRAAELSFLLEHSGASCFIGVANTKGYSPVETAVSLQTTLPTLKHIIAVGAETANTINFADAVTHPPATDLPTCNGDDLLCLLYTSGTTGNPKGVPIKNKWFMGNAVAALHDWEFSHDERILCVASYSHLYGLWTLILTLYTGGMHIIMPAFSPPEFVRLVQQYRPTGVFAVPAHIAALINLGLWDNLDAASIRFMVQAGIIVPDHIAIAIDEKLINGKVLQLFGMSELQCGSYTRFSDSVAVRTTTSGQPPAGMALKIVDDEGVECAAGIEGRLLFKGSAVFTGYLNNDTATAEAFTADGWFVSGDTARLTEAGHLQITGRFKDIINRGGIKYHPKEVEDLVMQMDSVANVAVVPYPDDVLGERACIFIQPLGDTLPTLAQITARLEEAGIAKFKWPERLELVDEMPLTPTRKIIRSRLQFN